MAAGKRWEARQVLVMLGGPGHWSTSWTVRVLRQVVHTSEDGQTEFPGSDWDVAYQPWTGTSKRMALREARNLAEALGVPVLVEEVRS